MTPGTPTLRDEVVPRLPSSLLLLSALLICSPAARGQPPVGSGDVVIVADGAGNYQYTSKMLRGVVAELQAPLRVETFVWSHGYKKSVPDQTDVAHARQQGQLLAAAVLAYRKENPRARIHLVGHSAGSMVVLSATEHLPPQTLDHIVLLAPSVSSEYDIRPALRSVRGTFEVHYSSRDWLYLGFCTRLVGCADRRYCGASGRVGFQVVIESQADCDLMPRLVQHPWQPDDRSLGHDGGHYGAYQPAYLKARVLPVLLGDRP
jgi:pimeloyl-ACP methyl ester carboxylesterase